MLLNVREAAKLLGVSASGLRKMNARGDVPRAVALGRCRRWSRDELESWVAAGCPARGKWEQMKATTRKGVAA